MRRVSGWQGEGKTTTKTGADWQRILRIMDEAYADYVTGMAALRKHIVGDVKRKLNDGAGPDHARRGARSRSAPARTRG